MKAAIIKGGIGLLGVGGLSAGGYFGIKTLQSPGTIKDSLLSKGYTPFNLDDAGWKRKFDEFKNNDTITVQFAAALKTKYPTLTVSKTQETADGGTKLKGWCEELLKIKENEKEASVALEHAKAYCASAPTTNI